MPTTLLTSPLGAALRLGSARGLMLVLAALLVTAGCRKAASEDFGTATVSVTDAATDELESLTVDITAITLTRLNGAVVSVLSDPARVDFTQLQDLSDVVGTLNLPSALYVSGSLEMNFTTAVARIIGAGTDAAIEDEQGNPLTGTVTVGITFGNGALFVAANRHKVLEFDFDLNNSVSVDTPGNTVTMHPTIVMRVDRSDARPLIPMGELGAVSTADSTFEIDLKRPNGPAIQTITCETGTGTVFQIDGTPYTGAPGVTALAALTAGTRVQAYGIHNTLAATFVVSYVEAGIGAIGSTDIIEGHVTARSSGAGTTPVLTIRGRGHNAAWTTLTLNTDFSVTTTGGTAVVRRGSATVYDLDDVNVGQRVRVYGTLSGTTMTTSLVRLQPTRIYGFANSPAAALQIEIDLQRIGLRDPAIFTFPSAVPATFHVQVGLLGTGGAIAGTPMEFQGFFAAVDDATRDFTADSVTNRENVPSGLRIRFAWPGLNAGITSATSTAITFSTTSAVVAVVDEGFVGSTLLATVPAASVVPTSSGFQLYAIRQGPSVSLFLTFAEFSAAIETRRAAGDDLFWFGALGDHDAGTNAMTSALAVAVFAP